MTVDGLRNIASAARAVVRVERPDRLLRSAMVTASIGPTLAGAVAGATARDPGRIAVQTVDSGNGGPHWPNTNGPDANGFGAMTYAELWRSAQSLARTLRAARAGEDSTVGLVAENSAAFVVGLVAISIVGADVVLMNTAFSAPQMADVVAREACTHLLVTPRCERLVVDVPNQGHPPTLIVLDRAALDGSPSAGLPMIPSGRAAQTVLLTSGTTGLPKGAQREANASVASLGFFRRLPVRSGDVVVIACPLFHAWGLTNAVIALALGSTIAVGSDLAPDQIVDVVDEIDADGLVIVPAILARVLQANLDIDTPIDLPSLRYIASSGSALPVPVVTETLTLFGPKLYNVYGSTEVALATIADPADLRTDPGTAGRAVPGIGVRLLDADGAPVPPGEQGRIFVDSGTPFDGYTGGGDKQRVGGFVDTGDVGHFEMIDGHELLFVDGRSDDMIISGGENVFPEEVENVIAAMEHVIEVAVTGVDDAEFGQRLAAHIVIGEGADAASIAQAVRSNVKANLARFKVPRDVFIVDELPRTATGKLRRSALTERLR